MISSHFSHPFLTPILDLLALSSSVISGYHPFLVPMIFSDLFVALFLIRYFRISSISQCGTVIERELEGMEHPGHGQSVCPEELSVQEETF